ncbi:MAG: hypothetical protein AAF527_03870 [Pseudomonadota bacterium]
MRRAHRKAHLLLWLLIAPATALGLVAALSARRPEPVETYLPPAAASAPAPTTAENAPGEEG